MNKTCYSERMIIMSQPYTMQLINPDWTGRIEHLRHACRGILFCEGKVLLCHASKRDHYIIPGGGVEENEDLAKCCEREMLEETGRICKALHEFFITDEFFDTWHHINHYFACELVEDTGSFHFTTQEIEAGYVSVWTPLDDAIATFGEYEKYRNTDVGKYGLYRREYYALKAFRESLREIETESGRTPSFMPS